MKIPSYPQIVLVAVIAVTAVWMHHRRVTFEKDIGHFETTLLQSSMDAKSSDVDTKQSYHDLPPCVQRYFQAVFGTSTNDNNNNSMLHLPRGTSIRSLEMNQTGHFSLDADQWYPFRAHQIFTTHPPGFVWKMDLSMMPTTQWWLSNTISNSSIARVHVVDALVPEKGGILKASLGGFVTLAHMEGQWEADIGELLRWLAEAFLYPTVLLPEENMVTWKAVELHDHQAIVSLSLEPLKSIMHDAREGIANKTVEMLVTFDPKTHFVTTLECQRPRANSDGTAFETGLWRGYTSNYGPILMNDGTTIWIPSHMECGWVQDDKVDLYFKGNNFDLRYTTTVSQSKE